MKELFSVGRQLFYTLKKVNAAIRRFSMIRNGDKIAVAVSGGKDSLCLLRLLQENVRSSITKYDLCAIHVHGDARGPFLTPENVQLEEWLKSLGIEYRIENMRLASGQTLPLSCQRCSWSRRKTIFEVANEMGCNVVALGHHADDLIETYLMNIFYHGRLQGLEPVRSYFENKISLIRPLILTPEKEIIRLSREETLPEPPEKCPMTDKTRRETVRKVIFEAEKNGRHVRANLKRLALECWQRDKLIDELQEDIL